jgi:hypothetical protein
MAERFEVGQNEDGSPWRRTDDPEEALALAASLVARTGVPVEVTDLASRRVTTVAPVSLLSVESEEEPAAEPATEPEAEGPAEILAEALAE